MLSEARLADRAAHELALNGIRELIDAGALGRRTRREGGSGLLKLAASVKQSPRGPLDFGFTSNDRFRLSVAYVVVQHEEEIANG